MKSFTLKPIILLMVVLWLLTGCSISSESESEGETQTSVRVIPVEVAQTESGNLASTLSFTGDLMPVERLALGSIVSGAVEDVFVEVGDHVRAGDPILQVEDTTFRAQFKQAQSGLTLAQLNKVRMENGPREEQILMAEAGLVVAEANLSRIEKGPRDEQVGIAAAAVEGAQAQLNSILTVTEDERTLAASNLAQAEAGLRLAQAEYDKIKWAGQAGVTPQALQLQQATIAYETALAAYNRQVNPDSSDIAPLQAGIRQAQLSLAIASDPFQEEDFALAQAGVQQAQAQLELARNPFTAEDMAQAQAGIAQAEAAVALAQFQLDNSVLRAPFDGVIAEVFTTIGGLAAPQIPAVTLISEDLEVKIEVPEGQISSLYSGQPAAIRVAAYPGVDFPALVSTIAPSADTSSHTFPTKIVPVDEEQQLRAGMFADVTILLKEEVNIVLAPRPAVTSLDGQDVVFVLAEDGITVRIRPVVLGLSDAERVQIVEGLSTGETIVTAGLSNLVDGSTVEVIARTE